MRRDDSREPGSDRAGSDDIGNDPGPITISTADAAIETAFEHPSDWKMHPDSTHCVETTQADEPNPLYRPGVRTVVLDPSGDVGGPDGTDGARQRGSQEREQNADQGGDREIASRGG